MIWKSISVNPWGISGSDEDNVRISVIVINDFGNDDFLFTINRNP